ncbi:hypothetical protein D3C71_1719170 [compost metagenome]
MTETTSLATPAATAALQVIIELIRSGDLRTGVDNAPEPIIELHQKLTDHFATVRKPPMSIG